ncbi:GGDEF domain-containing protein [Thiomicrospira sp. WB1]|uniref:GGDEF domain-containing protein n=1 Tax=Thiomicrospira sp. WB1 TaxID=1685380 RepID=UPI000748C340|nr:GGDEF domain-containing protein [Thiomicrospira sp. WB1]KUJ71945.1 hypothetical protein AVO41_05700 [Thiomicrospira sp. WB1]
MGLRVHLLWLFGLLIVGVWARPDRLEWPMLALQSLTWLPYLLALLSAFISLFLNRFQPILLVMALSTYCFFLSYGLPQWPTQFLILYPLLAFAMPCHLLLLRLLPEKGFHHFGWIVFQGLLWLTPFVVVLVGVQLLPHPDWSWLFWPVATEWIHLTWSALAITVLILLVWLARLAFASHRRLLDLAMPFVLVMAMMGLNSAADAATLAWWASLATLAVLLAMVFDAHHLAYTDTLTGLKGRRALFESFAGLGRRYAIAMMDIDHFKKFNDRYGHETGDRVLQAVATHLKQSGMSRVYRYGGEEFTLVFPGKTAREALPVLESVRERIANKPLLVQDKTGQKKTVRVTASFGVAEKDAQNGAPEAVMQAADAYLYQAKKAGRNCVKGTGLAKARTGTTKTKRTQTTRPGKK